MLHSRYILMSFFFAIIACFTGCNKDTWPQPHFILKYTAVGGTYNKEADYNSNNPSYDLTPLTSISTFVLSADSILIRFNSELLDVDGNHQATVSVTKLFHRSQLDSTSTGYRIKNDNDFYSLFTAGTRQIGSDQLTDPYREGMAIIIKDTTPYMFEPPMFTVPTAPQQDAQNSFEIMNSETDINFISVDGLPTLQPLRLIMVTVNFKCRLYNFNSPNNERIFTNGTFQGYFRDN